VNPHPFSFLILLPVHSRLSPVLQFPAAEAVKFQEAPLRTAIDAPLAEEMQSPAAEASAVDFLNSLVDFQACDTAGTFDALLQLPQRRQAASTIISATSALNWSQ